MSTDSTQRGIEDAAISNGWIEAKPSKEAVAWIKRNASRRNANGESRGWTSKTSNVSDHWHTLGLAGEWAIYRTYGLKITRILNDETNLNEPDMSYGVESKSCFFESGWKLFVNEDQIHDDCIYVLTITRLWPEKLYVAGWTFGSKLRLGRKTKHSTQGHYMYSVRHEDLYRPRSLLLNLEIRGFKVKKEQGDNRNGNK